MNTLNQTAINNNTDEAHPSLGKALSPEHAMRRLNHKGHWAAERKGKIRVVEFHEQPNGDSQSKTLWFETWEAALTHYGMDTEYADRCGFCGHEHNEAEDYLPRVFNPLGQWVCHHCYDSMNETMGDLFHYSQGKRWTI